MNPLSRRPARPRSSRKSPSYPRAASVGAAALIAACAATACVGEVVDDDQANGMELICEGADCPQVGTATEVVVLVDDGDGGDWAGGIGDEWNEGGSGGYGDSGN